MRNEIAPFSRISSFPSRLLREMEREMDNVFENFPRTRTRQGQFTDDSFYPQCELMEEDGNYLLMMDLPGFKKDDIEIDLEERQITIKGERNEEKKREGRGEYYSERKFGSFMRRFELEHKVDRDKAEASFLDGVLHLTLPMAEKTESKRIEVKSEKGGLLNKLLGRSEKESSKSKEGEKEKKVQ